jgi:cytochrome b561
MVTLRYTRVAVVLHWLVAVLITVNVVLALSADHVPDDAVRSVIDTHKSIGITVLGLALLRILWRLGHRPPAAPALHHRLERMAARLAHLGLYLLMLLLPLSGWLHDSAWKDAATHPMHWFGLFEWPRIGAIMTLPPGIRETLHTRFGQLHTALSYVLYALLALHIAGALKHQWIDGEPSLQRMSVPRTRRDIH